MQRIAVARLWHEGNSFTPVPTRLADFRNREWRLADEVPAFYRGTRTEIGAAVDFFGSSPFRTHTAALRRGASRRPGRAGRSRGW